MDNFTAYKHAIETKVTDTIIASLENGKLKEADLPALSDLILERIDGIDSEEKLEAFLEELAAQWDIFAPILSLEVGKRQEQKEKAALDQAISLVHTGNIDDAISLAKTATE